MKKKKVVWTLSASKSLDEYCAFIEKDSPTAAKKVKTEIIPAAGTLAPTLKSISLTNYETNIQKMSVAFLGGATKSFMKFWKQTL